MKEARTAACRHPLYQAADELKKVFTTLGFQIIDNGTGPELEETGGQFATWKAPQEAFAWEDDPIRVDDGTKQLQLRTRILPAQLRSLPMCPPFRILTFGRVYRKEAPGAMSSPMRHRLEGFVAEQGLALTDWQRLWGQVAAALYGAEAEVRFRSCGTAEYAVDVQDPAHKNDLTEGWFNLAYTGPATVETLHACGANNTAFSGWVFVIDVERFTMKYFSLKEIGPLFENDVRFLEQFRDKVKTPVGNAPEDLVGETLRKLGYYEVAPHPFYPDDSYKKANMVYAVDNLRDHFSVCGPACADMAHLRTVLTIGTETVLGFNYRSNNTVARIYEISHIYRPWEEEQLSLAMAAYGEDVDFDSFKRDVQAVLDTFGLEGTVFVSTDQAPAFDPEECLILCDKSGYIGCSFGKLHEVAQKSQGIDVPVYMAQMDLTPLLERSAKK